MLKKKICFLLILSLPFVCFAKCDKDPWYTGPFIIEESSNVNYHRIHSSLIFHYIVNYASYNSSWHKYDVKKKTKIMIPDLYLRIGLLSWLDFSVNTAVRHARKGDYEFTYVKDTSIKFGFQLLRESQAGFNLRLVLKEYFPTGKYQHLDPYKDYVDATGSGAYNTAFGLSITKLFCILNNHTLNLIGSSTFAVPSNVKVNSPNVYTGLHHANGTVYPGKTFNSTFAFVFNFTRNIVYSMDVDYLYISKTRFKGIRTTESIPLAPLSPAGTPLIPAPPPVIFISQVGTRSALITISSSLEYNFSRDLGIMFSYCTTLRGKNLSAFNNFAGTLSYTF